MNETIDLPRVKLADDESTTFVIRWRGRQEGPYPAAVVEAKLAANEIGLLHEILQNGQWITIRDYIAQREAVLRAEQAAKELRERIQREEAERRAREEKERRQEELRTEEALRNAKSSTPPQGGWGSDPPLPSPHIVLSVSATLFLIAGLAVAGYFFLAFDASVSTGTGRVVNLGLMADRQNGIIIGIGVSLVGAIMLVLKHIAKR